MHKSRIFLPNFGVLTFRVLDLACTTNGFVHHKWLVHDHANAKWAVRHRTPNSRSESEVIWGTGHMDLIYKVLHGEQQDAYICLQF